MKKYITLIITAFVIFIIGNYADFELQAYQFKWHSLFDLSYRAPKWTQPLDAIPHDAWHIMQTINNTFDKIGAVLITVACFYCFERLTSKQYLLILLSLITMFAFYLLARGIGFTLPRLILQGY